MRLTGLIRAASLVGTAALLPLLAPKSASSCVVSNRSPGQAVGYDAVQLVGVGLTSNQQQALQNGMNEWNATSCNQGGTSFPRFQFGAQGAGRTIEVLFKAGIDPDRPERCGFFVGNRITLFEKARLPGSGHIVHCDQTTILKDTVTHELGHLLGLQDNGNSGCNTHIMAPVTITGSNDYVDRSAKPAECSKVAETMVTPHERAEQGGPGGGGGCAIDPCPNPDDPAPCPPGVTCSPVVVDLSRMGFAFTGLDDPVWFDLDADKDLDLTGWTAVSKHRSALLCLDRNRNGTIDSGGELFGDATPFLDGSLAANGYEVLFELDYLLGNRNAWVDAGDGFYGDLRLWLDANHDGVSQPAELLGLAEAGVVGLATEHYAVVQYDEHGNYLRYWSEALILDGLEVQPTATVDVFFVMKVTEP